MSIGRVVGLVVAGLMGLQQAQAAPVAVEFDGAISYVENFSSDLFAVSDTFHGLLHYDSATATVVMDQGAQKFYEVAGASLTVTTAGGTVFTNDPTAPVRFLVRNFAVDGLDITFSTVPLDALLVPLAPAPYGVTDLRFALQDNSATALDSTQIPDATSPIWNAGVRRLDMTADPNGYCSTGICNGSPDAGAVGQLQSLTVGVPEPSTWALLAVALCTLALAHAKRALAGIRN